VEIPALFGEKKSLAYLGGHRVSELFEAELFGTEVALREAGRPTARLTLRALDAWHVGYLMQMLEVATVFAGHLYEVDPFDQPGVERGKIVAAALLGKEGLDDVRRELGGGKEAPRV
jgi:glucose-6-phosphate isomerase